MLTTYAGEPLAVRTLAHHFTKFCRENGFGVSFHALRHSCAITMLTSGVDVYTAASRLGHDPYVLLKVYSRFIKEADDAAAEKLNSVFA